MYSGITRGLFAVTQVEKKPGLIRYDVQLNADLVAGLEIGASVAIDGVCQTVVQLKNNTVTFEAMATTLQLTTLSDLYVGRNVSIEKSLRYGDVIGGHELAGHIIGKAQLAKIVASENNLMLILACPKEWLKYIFPKGFIAVDGSSLTVAEVDFQAETFTLHLIPETLRVTNFGNKKIGDQVNIELDFKTQAIVDTVVRMLHEREQMQRLIA